MSKSYKNLKLMGWREWLSLPDLGIEKVKAKIDTGARTSTLHAFGVEGIKKNGKHLVQFSVHPIQRRMDIVVACVAPVLDIRWITDSSGNRERRYIIETTVVAGDERWVIELTLANRDTMRFRMLLGRNAVKYKFLIDPASSYIINSKDRNL